MQSASAMRSRRAIGRLLSAVCAILFLGLAAPAFAYDIFHVYVAGDDSGTIEVEGDSVMPPGTCGIRFYNPEAWYWAEGDYAELGPLDLWNNGVDVGQISFSGPYPGCGGDPYLFTTPATPEGWIPAGAFSLVVQIDPDDVEWLDVHQNPIPKTPTPPPPPPPVCVTVPEFCGLPSDYGTGLCTNFPEAEICNDSENSDMILVRATDLAAAVPHHIAVAQKGFTAGQTSAALKEINLARSRLQKVMVQKALFRQHHSELSMALGREGGSSAIARALSSVSAGFELTLMRASRCDRDLERAKALIQERKSPNWAALAATCGPTSTTLASSRTSLGRVQAWGVPQR